MDSPDITIGSFCSGVGWLDLAVRFGCEHFGWRTRPAFMCEWESYAASVLRSRMEDASLEPCPIFCGDLRDFDGRAFRGLVDIAIAGLPCQPYSTAGKQHGTADDRSYGNGDGPLPHFLRIVAEMRPALVFLENVPPFVTGIRGVGERRSYPFRDFGSVLSGLGYEIENPVFITAEAVGASHKRERVFVLAHSVQFQFGEWAGRKRKSSQLADTASGRFGIVRESSECEGFANGGERIDEPGREPDRRTNEVVGNAEHSGTRDGIAGIENATPSSERGRMFMSTDASGVLADAERSGTYVEKAGRQRSSRRLTAESGQQLGGAAIFAPAPNADWRTIPEFLWPAIKPGVRLLADEQSLVLDESRADQLRCSGNGVVVTQAAVAFIELMRRIIERESTNQQTNATPHRTSRRAWPR